MNNNSEIPIYLDYNASTPIYPEVANVMRPLLETGYANPSSPHEAAVAARAAIDIARQQVADLLGAAPDEIVFTSGGSEANNYALRGAFNAQRGRGNHIITSQVEHPAITETCRYLETQGAQVIYLAVDGMGRVDPDDVRKAITEQTTLISIMHSNNEVGTLQPIAEIAQIAAEHDVLMHTDAAQSPGKVSVNVVDSGVNLVSLAGHKFGAPKGIGVLYIRRGVILERLIHGAGHEVGRRAGTESALLIAALGKAAEIAAALSSVKSVRTLRDFFWEGLRVNFGDRVLLNGDPIACLPNTLNVSFLENQGATVLQHLDGIAASTGSACHTGQIEPSPVLTAMGIDRNRALSAVRFSLGHFTTKDEIEVVLRKLKQSISTKTE
jgi:cysteine desulfurase